MEKFIKSVNHFEIIEDSNEKYHSKGDFIGASGLKHLKKSPAHYKESLTEKKEKTEALIFGSAYHTYCLERDKFDREYYIYDEKDILEVLISEGSKKPRATNNYKEWFDNEINQAAGRDMLDIIAMEKIKFMASKMKNHRYCNSLLNGGISEMSVYVEITIFDGRKIKIKIRPDKFKKEKRLVIDLKSIAQGMSDASINGFPKQCANMDYHIQAALYSDIMEAIEGKEMLHTFIFIVQEKSAPYAFNLFEASAQFISQGRYEYEQLLLLYIQCQENNSWPGYQVFCENKYGINQLNLPAWAINEINFYNHKF